MEEFNEAFGLMLTQTMGLVELKIHLASERNDHHEVAVLRQERMFYAAMLEALRFGGQEMLAQLIFHWQSGAQQCNIRERG